MDSRSAKRANVVSRSMLKRGRATDFLTMSLTTNRKGM